MPWSIEPIFLELRQANTDLPILFNMAHVIRIAAHELGKSVRITGVGWNRRYFNIRYVDIRKAVFGNDRLRFFEVASVYNGMPVLLNTLLLQGIRAVKHEVFNRDGRLIRTLDVTEVSMAAKVKVVAGSNYHDMKAYIQSGTPLPASPLLRIRHRDDLL